MERSSVTSGSPLMAASTGYVRYCSTSTGPSAGAAVTICGRTRARLEEATQAIEATAGHGGCIQWIAADVTAEDDVAAAVAKALEPTGRLDGCVANAGGGGGMAPYHALDTDEFLRILHLNVLGTMLCVKHTATHMVAAGGGSFVGMSSIAGHQTHTRIPRPAIPWHCRVCHGREILDDPLLLGKRRLEGFGLVVQIDYAVKSQGFIGLIS